MIIRRRDAENAEERQEMALKTLVFLGFALRTLRLCVKN
jgi:hypothetical protein